MKPVRCQWSDAESGSAEFAEAATLRRHLLELAAKCSQVPIVATLTTGAYCVSVGLGREESILLVQREREADGLAREWFAVGSDNREGYVEFWLHGEHHCEYEARHLMPFAQMLDAAVAFVETHELGREMEWEENTF